MLGGKRPVMEVSEKRGVKCVVEPWRVRESVGEMVRVMRRKLCQNSYINWLWCGWMLGSRDVLNFRPTSRPPDPSRNSNLHRVSPTEAGIGEEGV